MPRLHVIVSISSRRAGCQQARRFWFEPRRGANTANLAIPVRVLHHLRFVSATLPTVIATLVALAVVGVSAAIAGGRTHRQTSYLASVQAVFRNAAVVLQAMTVPPAASVDHAATAAELSSMQTNGITELQRYFSPSLAQQGSSRLAKAKAALADPNFRVLGAGVSDVSYDKVELHGNTATVAAHVTEWSRMAQLQGTKAVVVQPSNVLIVNSTLARVDAASPWIITSFDWKFAPGNAP